MKESGTQQIRLFCKGGKWGGHITDAAWRKILAEKEPFTLYLGRFTNPDADLEQLTSCENLRKLIIHRGSGLTSAALPIIARIPNLEDLRISNCPISGETLATLTKANNLVRLEFTPFYNVNVTDDQIAELNSCHKLQSLNIRGAGVTENCLTALVTLKELQQVEIYTDLTDAGIKSLTQLKSLTEISAAGEQITDSGIALLASLPHLEKISLHRCSLLSGRCFAKLNQLTNLKSITLYSVGLTDEGLASLAMLPNLESLEISNSTSFTEKGLENLTKLPHLQRLYIHGANIPPELLRQLREKMPSCEIKF